MTFSALITLIVVVVLTVVAIIWTVAIAVVTLFGLAFLAIVVGSWIGGKMIWDYIKP